MAVACTAFILSLSSILWFYKSVPSDDYQLVLEKYERHKALADNYRQGNYKSVKELPRRDRPDLAFLQDFELTKDPALGYPPSDRRFEAFEIGKQKLAKKAAAKAIDNVIWQERGPNNVGGRTRAVMFDPNDPNVEKVWAGSVSGGLWYNNNIIDPNSEWRSYDDFMANLAISSIVYDPTDLSTFYLGTGELFGNGIRGAGVWKTVDAGQTWVQLPSTDNENFRHVQKMAVTQNGTVLAGTIAGMYRSENDGDSWTRVLLDDDRIADIEIATDGVIFASSGAQAPGQIYRSVDDGLNWENISPNDNGRRIEIAVAPSNANVVYAIADRNGTGRGEIGFFVVSSDQGDTWQNLSVPRYTEQSCSFGDEQFTRGQAGYDLILAVNPSNENDIIAGGIDLNRSLDAGSTWSLVSYWTGSCDDYVHADQHMITYRPGTDNEALFGNDGGVFYSANINATDPEFDSRNNHYNVTQFYAVATKNELNANYYLAGSQDNGTQRFDKAGVGNTLEVTGGDGGYCFVDQLNSDIQVTSYVYNSYRYSNNGGGTFFDISNDQTRGNFINPTAYDSDAKILYSAGNPGELMRITNMDTDPSSQEAVMISQISGVISAFEVSPYSDNTIFVGSTGTERILKITDANGTPSAVALTGNLDVGNVSSLDLGASEDQILLTYSNYGVTSVFETLDGGTTWANKEGDLPDMPVRWGIYNPNNRDEVLLATEVGVWSTDNFSAENPVWEPTNEGLANVRSDMLVYREADQQVVVATHGRGVYTSNVFADTPDAAFKLNSVVAYEGQEVSFSDESLLAADWVWDFGDGGSSSDQNPNYTFGAAGSYDVMLSINSGAQTITKTVNVLPARSTPYLTSDGGDFESNPNDFVGSSLINDDLLWERGTPGNRLTTLSSGTNAWKTDLDGDLTTAGINQFALFTPVFDLSNTEKEYSISFKKSIENAYCNSPFAMQVQYSLDYGANWSTLGTTGEAYGSVNWYNRGPNEGCAISPEIFEDQLGWVYSVLPTNDPPIDNAADNEDTQYKLNFLAGESSVAFRFVVGVGNSGDESSYDRDGFMIDDFEIQVTDPTAAFAVDNPQAAVGRELQFSYLGSGATSFSWDFGDGGSSTDQNPKYTYQTSGKYTVSLTITSTAGGTTEVKTDYINILQKYDAPYSPEDGGNFDVNQDDFVAGNIAGTPWELGNSNISGKDGTASGDFAWVTGLADAEYVDLSEAYLYSPTFDMSAQKKYDLRFKAKYRFEVFDEEDKSWDGFLVEYSTDLGINWIKLNNKMESGWYNSITTASSIFGPNVPIFSGDTEGEFETYSTDLTFLSGESDVMFRVYFRTDWGSTEVGMALDDFSLDAEDLVNAVPEFTYENTSGCSGQVVTFSDASTGAVDSYSWDFGAGASPGTATGAGPHNVTYNADQLQTSTVSLTVVGTLNGEVTETKADEIVTAPIHTPTIEEVDNGDAASYELQASEGESYQWYLNDEVISGATSRSHTTSTFGEYQVEVDVAGCVAISDIYELDNVTAIDDEFDQVVLFPNPTDGIVRLQGLDAFGEGNGEMAVIDFTGRTVMTLGVNDMIDLSGLRGGSYLLLIKVNQGEIVRRITIK